MLPLPASSNVALLLVLLASPWLGVPATAQPAAPQVPMQVTTDTPEYCLHLADRVQSLVHLAVSPPPQEVHDLSSEGQRMCASGQTRGGIMRLRKALMLMMHDDAAAER